MNASLIEKRANILLGFLLTFSLSFIVVSCEKNDIPAFRETSANEDFAFSPIVANGTPYSWAKPMIDSVTAANNFYVNNRDSITWAGGFSNYRCETDCSGLMTGLFKQSYGYTSTYFKTWAGLYNSYALTYYNEIKAKDHFSIITPVTNIRRGDIIAIKYPTSADNTGHIMVVADSPVLRTAPNPLITGTRQYEIPVMDCYSSGHGSTDTRYTSSGIWNDGIGKGIFSVYVNSKGP